MDHAPSPSACPVPPAGTALAADFFAGLALGEAAVYHRGFLAVDRQRDAAIDALAAEALRLSTGLVLRRENSRSDIPGEGRFELSQQRTDDGACVYYARRIR